ncbi:MAG: hypothetical protein Q4G09_05405, partial [Clostridia bacterium]|nr:hypothetical protein [Clostridia bacterium]
FRTALKNYWDGTTEYPLYQNNLTYSNLKASAGMYNNFASIPFYTESNYTAITPAEGKYNIGWYNAVTKDGTSVEENTNGGNLFLTGNADKVRMLTLPEINDAVGSSDINSWNYTISDSAEPAPGLFILNKLPDAGLADYTYSSTGWYWLASPYSSNTGNVHYVAYNGDVNSNSGNTHGGRPIVSLGSDIRYSVQEVHEGDFTYLELTKVTAE